MRIMLAFWQENFTSANINSLILFIYRKIWIDGLMNTNKCYRASLKREMLATGGWWGGDIFLYS